jgi:hypothetical protein
MTNGRAIPAVRILRRWRQRAQAQLRQQRGFNALLNCRFSRHCEELLRRSNPAFL